MANKSMSDRSEIRLAGEGGQGMPFNFAVAQLFELLRAKAAKPEG